VKPSSWQSKEGGALDVTLADKMLRHNVLDRLSGRRDIRYGIRAWLPYIVNARYNKLLRIRSKIGKAGGLFVDTVTNPPYVLMHQKIKQGDGSFRRTTVNVNEKFQDQRLADPWKHYLNWSLQPPTYGQAPAPSNGLAPAPPNGPTNGSSIDPSNSPPASTSATVPQLPAAPTPLDPTASIRAAKRSIDEGDQQPPNKRKNLRRGAPSAFGSAKKKDRHKNKIDTA
jgi:hypothetical protein